MKPSHAPPKRSFASDNNSGVHPTILAAIEKVNVGHEIAYGNDEYTRRAIAKFRQHFGKQVDVYFVFGGTGANVVALTAMTQPYHAVICAENAHINVDECGAPEKFTGCKLIPVPTTNGKISPKAIEPLLGGVGDEHHVQRRVVSISQSTEMGTVYKPGELKELATFAHEQDMLFHIDGARIANAAASLDAELREMTTEVGVDVLSFGGTKNGMMYGEAIVVFNKELSRGLKFIRKQGAQLPSKMRFIAAQFEALLSNMLWYQNAEQANQMANLLKRKLVQLKLPKTKLKITQAVQSNAVFARIPKRYADQLRKRFFFYDWNEAESEVRFMTSFDTTADDVAAFIDFVRRTIR